MKKIYTILSSLLVSAFLLINISCGDDCDHLVLDGKDAFITSCLATAGSASFGASSIDDSITIQVPEYVDLYEISVKIEISEHAEISPLPEAIRDWSVPVTFTVTSSKGGVAKDYVVKVVQAVASNEYEGAVRIGSQKELDNFFENGYTKVQNIILYGGDAMDPIKDLSSMSYLKEVPGDLTIREISAREIIFENLESVGQFYLHSPSATKVRLPKLKFVAERFKIGKDDPGVMPTPHSDMEEVYLPNLEYVGGAFILFWCSKLESLESLANLNYIGKELRIDGGLFTNLIGLENITSINGNVTLNGNMSSLEGFNIESVKGVFTLFGEDITDLSALSVLKHVETGIVLKNNRDLKNLAGLEHINTSNIQIENFLSLESLEGFPQMTTVNTLILKGLPKLTNLSALSKLERVENDFFIFALPELVNLGGLENLESVENNFSLDYLPKLMDISALTKLNNVRGKLKLAKLNLLTDISVFSKLTEIGNLYLENLLVIEDLTGLNNITKITNGGLTVFGCPLLADLSPLGGITDINFYQQSDKIMIERNPMLGSYIPVGDLLKKYIPMRKVSIKNNLYNPTVLDVNEDRLEGEGGTGISAGGKG